MIASVAVEDLVELAWVSLAATIALSVAVSTCVVGFTRAHELRRAGHGGTASAYVALGLAGGLALTAGIVAALAVIITG